MKAKTSTELDSTGFTLVELLVAMVVFTLIIVMLTSVLGTVSGGWQRTQQNMDNFSAARALLTSLDRDLADAVIRQDLPAFSDSGSSAANANDGTPIGPISFYTRQYSETAYDPNGRALSYVSYARIHSGNHRLFERMSIPRTYADYLDWRNAFSFNNSPPATPFDPSQTAQLCEGVYGEVTRFINVDGTFAATFNPPALTSPDARAIRVSLLILSDQADQLAQKQGLSTSLENDFATVVPAGSSNASVASAWAKLLSSGMNYPAKILSGIRAYERVVYLSPSDAFISHAPVAKDPDF